MQANLIQNKIYEIRSKKVMLDFDLAEMYEVKTKKLRTAVKRFTNKFPSDFIFVLTREEYSSLRSQLATLENDGIRKYSKLLPIAFTEHGIAMLSGIFESEKDIQLNIEIIRTFITIKQREEKIADLIFNLAKRYNKSPGELCTVITSLIKTLKRRKLNTKESLSSLKQNYQHEFIQKIFLRRLRR